MTNGEIFAALWKQAEDDGAYAFYRGEVSECNEGLEGAFEPPSADSSCPFVFIVPEKGRDIPSPPDKPVVTGPYVLRDLIIFAHVYGHLQSWITEGTGTTASWLAYSQTGTAFRTTDDALSALQGRLFMDEERRAWDLGWGELAKLGFDDREAFESHRARGLRAYEDMIRKRLQNGDPNMPLQDFWRLSWEWLAARTRP